MRYAFITVRSKKTKYKLEERPTTVTVHKLYDCLLYRKFKRIDKNIPGTNK